MGVGGAGDVELDHHDEVEKERERENRSDSNERAREKRERESARSERDDPDYDEDHDDGRDPHTGERNGSSTYDREERERDKDNRPDKDESIWDKVVDWTVPDKFKEWANDVSDWWEKNQEDKARFREEYNKYHDPSTSKEEKEALERKYRDSKEWGRLSLLKETPEERESREKEHRSDSNERARERREKEKKDSKSTYLEVCKLNEPVEVRLNKVFNYVMPNHPDLHRELAKIAKSVTNVITTAWGAGIDIGVPEKETGNPTSNTNEPSNSDTGSSDVPAWGEATDSASTLGGNQ